MKSFLLTVTFKKVPCEQFTFNFSTFLVKFVKNISTIVFLSVLLLVQQLFTFYKYSLIECELHFDSSFIKWKKFSIIFSFKVYLQLQ